MTTPTIDGLRGRPVGAGHAADDIARAVGSDAFERRPPLIARRIGATDVASAARLAREHGLEIAIRGGGRNDAGCDARDGGIVIEFSTMRAARADPAGLGAWPQGGAPWGDLDHETRAHPDRVREAYGGSVHDRPAAVKTTYDPEDVLHHSTTPRRSARSGGMVGVVQRHAHGSRRITMRSHAVIAAVLVAMIHAQAVAGEASVDWAVHATIIDGCSCRMLCPCIFGSPATVDSAATHEHAGHRSCRFNQAFLVNQGHHGGVKLDGMKFWFAGDKGDAKTVELTFEPSATQEQREAVRAFMSHFLPLKWESYTEGPDAEIEWRAGAVRAEARLDGGKAAEVVLIRNPGATGEGTTVIKNMSYFGSTRNEGFNILPVEFLAYRRGPKPAPFEFAGPRDGPSPST
jgi:uncharacterized membrane protein